MTVEHIINESKYYYSKYKEIKLMAFTSYTERTLIR